MNTYLRPVRTHADIVIITIHNAQWPVQMHVHVVQNGPTTRFQNGPGTSSPRDVAVD